MTRKQSRFDFWLQIAITAGIVAFMLLGVKACWQAGLPLAEFPWEPFAFLTGCALFASPLLDLGFFGRAIVFQVAYLAVRYILNYVQGI